MRHGKVAAVGQRGLNKFILDSQILEPVVELSIGHVDGQLLKDIGLLGIKVESHLREPLKAASVGDLVGEQRPTSVSLVDQLSNLQVG